MITPTTIIETTIIETGIKQTCLSRFTYVSLYLTRQA